VTSSRCPLGAPSSGLLVPMGKFTERFLSSGDREKPAGNGDREGAGGGNRLTVIKGRGEREGRMVLGR